MTDLHIDENAARGEVYGLRRALHAAGFIPLPVLTTNKKCVETDWQNEWRKEDPAATITAPEPGKLNTGILCRGLRVIDIDVDDPIAAKTIETLAVTRLGATVRRWREGSPRCALLFRAAEGTPPKRAIKSRDGKEKIEVLGEGNYIVVDGLHPGGQPYRLSEAPDFGFKSDTLPVVTEDQISDFLAAAAPYIGADQDAGTNRNAAGNNAASGRFDGLPAPLQLDLVRAAFNAIDNTRTDGREQWRDLIWAACDAETRGCAGAIDEARAWARRGAGYDGEAAEAAFEAIVDGFDQCRGIGIGTLIHSARHAGGGAALDAIFARGAFASPVYDPAAEGESEAEYVPRYQLAGDIQPDTSPHLWAGLIRRGTTAVLYAPPYTGKTILAAALAFSVAQGLPCMGRKCEQGGVYIVESEGKELLADNVRAIYAANAMDINSAPIGISDAYLSLLDPASVLETIKDIEHFAKHNGGCSLIVIDTLSQSIAGQDENSQATISQALKQIALIGRQIGAATMPVHHTGKVLTAGMRGSSVLGANVHSVIALTDEGNGLVKMTPEKFKGGRLALPEFFRIEERTLRTDMEGRPVTAGVAVHVPAGEARAAEVEVKMSPPEKALRAALDGTWPGSGIAKAAMRERFNLHHAFDTPNPKTRTTTFNRAIKSLIKKKLICMTGDEGLFSLAHSPRRLTEATQIFGPMH